MCLFIFMAAQGQNFFNTTDVVTRLINFGDYSGTIVGIFKGYIGLSGAVLIQVQVYETICMGNPSTYILFLALFPTLVSLLLMGQVRIYGTNSLDDRKHLNGFAAIAVLFDVYFTVNTICDNLLSF